MAGRLPRASSNGVPEPVQMLCDLLVGGPCYIICLEIRIRIMLGGLWPLIRKPRFLGLNFMFRPWAGNVIQGEFFDGSRLL